MSKNKIKNSGPLKDVRVLDLSRILAGPSATQILGDFGADIVKVEHPIKGDDTRKWGPPYVDEVHKTESSYYLSANRNKRSIAIDFATKEGQEEVKKLAQKADILIENYKVGTLEKYGLDYKSLKAECPQLVYCSLTGFGQTGAYKNRAGYDFLVQGMGGIMSLTGAAEPDAMPYKTGVAVADLMAGMYCLSAILAALHYRTRTGEGQHIDVSLFDTQVAWLSNAAQYYLTSGKNTPRMGNAHPMIVPYEAFPTSDGYIILAIGNDRQFQRFCLFAECLDIAEDTRFETNQNRVEHRTILVPLIAEILSQKTQDYWIEGLEKCQVPCGPVNDLKQVFDNPQIKDRDMVISMEHPQTSEPIKMLGNPVKFSKTQTSYRYSPPLLGEDREEILQDWLGDAK